MSTYTRISKNVSLHKLDFLNVASGRIGHHPSVHGNVGHALTMNPRASLCLSLSLHTDLKTTYPCNRPTMCAMFFAWKLGWFGWTLSGCKVHERTCGLCICTAIDLYIRAVVL